MRNFSPLNYSPQGFTGRETIETKFWKHVTAGQIAIRYRVLLLQFYRVLIPAGTIGKSKFSIAPITQ